MKVKNYNKTRLKDYSLWYYFRYFPSDKRLKNKLFEKSQSRELVQEVFSEISYLLNEEEIIKTKINTFLGKNKNLRYIRQKLAEKLFDKKLVEEQLKDYLESPDSLLDKNKTFRKIQNYKSKGKSINYIRQNLIERNEDRELVNSCIEQVFGANGESENLRKEFEKLCRGKGNLSKTESQKMASKLQQKGFRYDDIKTLL